MGITIILLGRKTMSSKKTYAEFKKEIDTIRKSINKIPPSTECSEERHYKIDPKHKVVFYDHRNNQNGKPDYDLNEAIGNMKEIAAREKMPVVTLFGDCVLIADEKLPAEECKMKFYEYEKQKDEAYRQTPEYKKEKALRQIAQQKKEQQLAADAKILASTSLELSNPKAFEEQKADPVYGKNITDFAEDFAKLMQNEITGSSNHKLTKKMVKDAFQRAALKYEYEAADGVSAAARNLLIQTWKYGEELGKVLGFSAKEIQAARHPEQTEKQYVQTKNRIKIMIEKVKSRMQS